MIAVMLQGRLSRHEMACDGTRRTWWAARADRRDAPVIVVFHGLGMNGRDVARFTGLDVRAPAAGISALFPDALAGRWGLGAGDRSADVAYVRAVIARATDGDPSRPIALVGLAAGAWFAEFIARTSALRVTGVVLAAGTALEVDRVATPCPSQAATVICFAGTADPIVPYDGGPVGARGPLGPLARCLAGRRTGAAALEAAGVDHVARDWVSTGSSDHDAFEQRRVSCGTLHVTRRTWSTSSGPRVAVYRIEGGGHGWPGGPQYLPTRVIGPVARDLDATGIALRELQRVFGAEQQRQRTGEPLAWTTAAARSTTSLAAVVGHAQHRRARTT